MSVVKIITGHDTLTARQILSWFARQEEGLQVGILKDKRIEHERLRGLIAQHGITETELAALVTAAEHNGWSDEQAYRSSKSVSPEAARRISRRRTARAGAYRAHREQVRIWLAKHWGKVMDMRRAGLSWRRVSAMIADEHGVSISHSALHKFWRKWNEQL